MTDERVFLNEPGRYISNTRLVFGDTTYATANITAVRKASSPAGCRGTSLLLLLTSPVGFIAIAPAIIEGSILAWIIVAASAAVFAIAVRWRASLKPIFHIVISSSSGESSDLSSEDETAVDRWIAAISAAIACRR